MNTTILTLSLLTSLALDAHAQARYVTLKVDGSSPIGHNATNEVAIAANETFEVVYVPELNFLNSAQLTIIKDGTSFNYRAYYPDSAGFNSTARPLTMTGPAIVRLVGFSVSIFCTLRITPESFQPDKTLIIPADTAGATVALECSTDLLTWQTATNGFYTGTNGAKFFRIRADRTP